MDSIESGQIGSIKKKIRKLDFPELEKVMDKCYEVWEEFQARYGFWKDLLGLRKNWEECALWRKQYIHKKSLHYFVLIKNNVAICIVFWNKANSNFTQSLQSFSKSLTKPQASGLSKALDKLFENLPLKSYQSYW